MALLLHPSSDDEAWFDAFDSELPDVEVRLWPDVGDPADVIYAVLSDHDASDLQRYRNLRAILAMGAGVEQFAAPGMPDVTIVRLHDPSMSDEMAAYALHWTTRFQRRFEVFDRQQREAVWLEQSYTPAPRFDVGILGHGAIGNRVGRLFSDLGYRVNAWSRTGVSSDGVSHYTGAEQLDDFLAACDVVVNVLPSSASTNGLLDADRFAAFKPGSGLINMGRGATVDEPSLLDALDSGQLEFAVLDVVSEEPLPRTSPLWSHPRVTITPHVAGDTLIDSAAGVISANVRRLMEGQAPFPVYEPDRGY